MLSVRDVVRCWTDDGAICDVPERVGFGATAGSGDAGGRRGRRPRAAQVLERQLVDLAARAARPAR